MLMDSGGFAVEVMGSVLMLSVTFHIPLKSRMTSSELLNRCVSNASTHGTG